MDRYVGFQGVGSEDRQWIMHYYPQLYYRFIACSLEQQLQVWHDLCDRWKQPKRPHSTKESLFKEMADLLPECLPAFMDLTPTDMLRVNGYTRVDERKGGAWSTFVSIDHNLVGKVVTCANKSGRPDLAGTCYNEALVCLQMENRHINSILDVVVTGSLKNRLYFQDMCFIQTKARCDYHHWLKHHTKQAPETITDHSMQILEGLADLHEHQFVHLDIKPSNILYNKGTLSIADFGLTYRQTTQINTEGNKVTSWYRPPEVMASMIHTDPDMLFLRPMNSSMDMWSVGVVLWEMVSYQPMLHQLEDEEDIQLYFVLLMDVLDVPEPQDLLTWHVSPEKQAQVLLWCQQAKQDKKRSPTSHFHHLPDSFLQPFLRLVRQMLHWNPRRRPTASFVWNQLRQLLPGKTEPTMQTTPLRVIAYEERAWRRHNCTVEELNQRFDEVLERVKTYLDLMQRKMNLATDLDEYVDVIVLALELWLRNKYTHQHMRGNSLFSERERLHASLGLALQISRPFLLPHVYYRMSEKPKHEQQIVEQYITHSLDFQLYYENVVTQAVRKNSQQLTLSDIRTTFIKDVVFS